MDRNPLEGKLEESWEKIVIQNQVSTCHQVGLLFYWLVMRVSFFNLLNLRKTKRQCLEEAMEWDELNETGEIPDPDQAMEFSMLRDQSSGYSS